MCVHLSIPFERSVHVAYPQRMTNARIPFMFVLEHCIVCYGYRMKIQVNEIQSDTAGPLIQSVLAHNVLV